MMRVHLEAPHAQRQDKKAPKDVQEALRRFATTLASDPFAGTYVDLSRVPKETRKAWRRRLGPIENLWKADLAGAWRALYTIGSDDHERMVLVIEIVDHKQYDRLFGYQTS